MLSDICLNAGADVLFANMTFYCYGSDEACKTALGVISQIPWVKHGQSTIHVKLELANEHKEFVSGKKNGKINKIMNLANVQIIFDGFNEYNFYIDVKGSDYGQTITGLNLVELELPASLSFHVPDQYHKRIIGIGGQHIQTLMKKYSVFVKFSNAHDRGPVVGKEDDAVKLDNVICRTPSRNAQNLELVKQEIMDMVNRPDAEQVTEHVAIDRLLHRQLISTRMNDIERLEKSWNVKITFPSTEQASDVVLVSGPEFQVPNAIYGLLSMVPETHEVAFPATPEISEFLVSPEFRTEVLEKLHSQHCVEVTRKSAPNTPPTSAGADRVDMETLVFRYTRNDAGGLKDAIDFLISRLLVKGLDESAVKGGIPRPKSDSFEDNLPFFESRLLHRSEPSSILGTDSPTRSQFGDTPSSAERPPSERGSGPASGSFFAKFRKPGSMSSLSSFIGRNHRSHTNTSTTGPTNSPGGFFKHASSNASKASLQSMESRDSGFRNFWNDSGLSLTEHLEEEPLGLNSGAGAGVGAGVGAGTGAGASRAGYFVHGATLGQASTWPPVMPQYPSLHTQGLAGPASNGNGFAPNHPFAVQSMHPGDVTPTTTTPGGLVGLSGLTGPSSARESQFPYSRERGLTGLDPRPGTSNSLQGGRTGPGPGQGQGLDGQPGQPGQYASPLGFGALNVSSVPTPFALGAVGSGHSQSQPLSNQSNADSQI
jgi:hypothetical protein